MKETVKYMLLSKPVIHRYISEIEQMYGMDSNILRQRNEKSFLSLFRRAYDKSAFYKKLYHDAGITKDDIKNLDDIKKLPIITKEATAVNEQLGKDNFDIDIEKLTCDKIIYTSHGKFNYVVNMTSIS